jgi:hypothetical protein
MSPPIRQNYGPKGFQNMKQSADARHATATIAIITETPTFSTRLGNNRATELSINGDGEVVVSL